MADQSTARISRWSAERIRGFPRVRPRPREPSIKANVPVPRGAKRREDNDLLRTLLDTDSDRARCTLCRSHPFGSGARTRPPLDPHSAWQRARPRLCSPDPPCRGDRPATLGAFDPGRSPRHHDAQCAERVLKQVSSPPSSIELVRHQQSGKADAAAAQQAEERLGNSVVVTAVRRVRHQGRRWSSRSP